jgi:hypothetical protein
LIIRSIALLSAKDPFSGLVALFLLPNSSIGLLLTYTPKRMPKAKTATPVEEAWTPTPIPVFLEI